MNDNSIQNKSGSTPASLKKLFSSHVLKNTTLQRQISDIDYAKIKKLRELNFNTNSFLRKYDKYSDGRTSTNGSRRASIDVGLARALELNYNGRPSTRENNTSTSLARDAINDSCPYSLETWNKLVASQANIIEDYKREILYGDNERLEQARSSSDEGLVMCDMEIPAGERQIGQARLPRRRTLKPLQADIEINSFDDEAFDAEILEIQRSQTSAHYGRRHSVAVTQLSQRKSLDTGMKLPSIGNKTTSTSNLTLPVRKSSSDEKLSVSVSSEELRPLKVQNRRRHTLNMVVDVPKLTFQSPVPDVNTPNMEISTDDHSKGEGILKEQTRRTTPRPVANAAVFIQPDDNSDQTQPKPVTTMFDNKVVDKNNNADKYMYNSDDEITSDVRSARSSNSSIKLPTIQPNSSIIGQNDRQSPKRVSFQEMPEREDHSEIADSSVPYPRENVDSYMTSHPVGRPRRNSMTTATLNLLVDSHHGAAKLRYIAMLATEMEKEEAAKRTPTNSPEPDLYQELNNCRYLRLRRRDSVDSG